MEKLVIYYFSGTGNSLYVAKALQQRIPNVELIPMVSLLEKTCIEVNEKCVGFIFPIYMSYAPLPVRDFIKKLNFKSKPYIFAIVTRIGTTHGAFKCIDRILKKSNLQLNAYHSINMASNDPKFNYKVPTEDEIQSIELTVHKELDQLQEILTQQNSHRQKDMNYTTKIPFQGLFPGLVLLSECMKVNLYADSKCTGCGICAKVCLSNKIKMMDNKPTWQEEITCFRCSACLNYCPEQASQIKSFTENNGRYPHPYATITDIELQKGEIS